MTTTDGAPRESRESFFKGVATAAPGLLTLVLAERIGGFSGLVAGFILGVAVLMSTALVWTGARSRWQKFWMISAIYIAAIVIFHVIFGLFWPR